MTRFARARGLLRPVIVAAVGAALILAAVRFQRTAAAPAADVWPPPAATTSREGEGVVCFGTVDLEHGVAALTSIQPGRVTDVLVAENQQVSQGTELLRLEDAGRPHPSGRGRGGRRAGPAATATGGDAAQGLHPIRIAHQQAMRDAMHSRVETARRVLDREQRLAKSAIIIDSDRTINQEKIRELEAMERAEILLLTELKSQDVEVEIRRAESELKAAEARREQARLALEECRLRAPRPGTVLRILVGPGDVLGSQPGQPAVLFAADGPQVIRATVEQEFAGRVKEGMPALVRDDADPAAVKRGRVGRVAGWYSQRRTILHDPSQLSDVHTLECQIVLEPGQPRLRLGQSVRIFIGPVSP